VLNKTIRKGTSFFAVWLTIFLVVSFQQCRDPRFLLNALRSPVLFRGDATTAYLDLTAVFEHWEARESLRVKGSDVPIEKVGRTTDPVCTVPLAGECGWSEALPSAPQLDLRRSKPNQSSGYNQIRIDLHTQPGTLRHGNVALPVDCRRVAENRKALAVVANRRVMRELEQVPSRPGCHEV
jgi:hypothetical protein